MNQIFNNDPSLKRKKNQKGVVNETVIDLEFKFRLNIMMTAFKVPIAGPSQGRIVFFAEYQLY